MDWDALAGNFSQLAPLIGAAAGGGLHNGGFMAGIGDAMHEQNIRTLERAHEARQQFADQLMKIGQDEQNWNEPARTAAMQARIDILSNPNANQKDFQKHWQNVLAASQRPSLPGQQEQNAALTQTAGLQNLQNNTSPGAPGVPMQAGGALQMLLGDAQKHAAAPVGTVNGPLTPAERAGRQAEQFKAYQSLFGGSGGPAGGTGASGGGGSAMIPMMGIGPKGPTMHMRLDSTRPMMLQLRDGTMTPGYFDQGTQSYHRVDTGEAVVPLSFMSMDRPRAIETAADDGTPQTQIVSAVGSVGKTFRKPVRQALATNTDNGVVTKAPYNPYTSSVAPPVLTGTTPNRDLQDVRVGQANTRIGQAERGLALRGQSNDRQNAILDYNMSGQTSDVTGNITGQPGTRFTPAGTPLDVSGQPIAPKGYSQTKPPAAVQTRARVAGDARDQADTLLRTVANPALSSQFGPLEGRAMSWLVQKGIVRDTDIKAMQMQLASLESMNPAVHQMRNFAVAQDIAKRLGDLGQPYENFVAGVKTLRDFYDQVAKSGIRPVMPTAGQPKRVTAPTAPKAPVAGSNAPAVSPNMQIMQQIMQQLGLGKAKP